LPIAYCLLPIAYCLLPIASYLFPAPKSLLPAPYNPDIRTSKVVEFVYKTETTETKSDAARSWGGSAASLPRIYEIFMSHFP